MKKETISRVMRAMAYRRIEKLKADPEAFAEHMRKMTESAREKNTKERCACGLAWGHTGKHKPLT